MSMTESEATKLHVGIIGSGRKYPRSVGEYMDSIEELEQYRTIGTVDDVAFYKKCYDEESYEYCGEYGTDSCGCKDRMEYLEKKIAEYEAIGTVSEFRELKEKATAKKPLVPFTHKGCGNHCCPNCTHPLTTFCEDYNMEYCEWCGQKLDWSEGKE